MASRHKCESVFVLVFLISIHYKYLRQAFSVNNDECNVCFTQVLQVFVEQFPTPTGLTKAAIFNLVCKFSETGNMADVPRLLYITVPQHYQVAAHI